MFEKIVSEDVYYNFFISIFCKTQSLKTWFKNKQIHGIFSTYNNHFGKQKFTVLF